MIHAVLLLDESGSMGNVHEDVIGGHYKDGGTIGKTPIGEDENA